ncbi:MAG: multiple sugar transport system substrate-binding protein [Oceanicoccus sp.]|jgi:multiple sugar transport system substrate-binding protein
MKRSFTAISLIFVLLATSILPGCLRRKDTVEVVTQTESITLTVYGLFDSEDVYLPMIQQYESQNGLTNVVYKKFTNPDEYLELIINELAEGEGPDIFMMHNSWFPKHYKKLTPAPSTTVDADTFNSLFVEVTGEDLIIPDDEGVEQVWGLPLYVDTLALFYNKDHLEEAKPSTGEPSDTWEGIKSDVVLLNRDDQSFSRFERSGIAMGRSENILRAFDIMMLLLLQSKADFYSSDLTQVMFDTSEAAVSAFELYASFGLPSNTNYSWNLYLADEDSAEQEIATFAEGKTSMILGYTYAYEDIVNEVAALERKGESAIDINDIEVKEVPQIYDPNSTTETREAYASYFVPVVSRTSEHSDEAWAFLVSMVSEDNLRTYYETTHRPSALRSLISEQTVHPVYGVFASQVGYASGVPMVDPGVYEELFLAAIDSLIDTAKAENVVKDLADAIQNLIPLEGVKPTFTTTES